MTVMTIHDRCGAHSVTLYGPTSAIFREGYMLVACGDGRTREYVLRDIDHIEVEEDGK